uniref:Enhancer of rudimentary-like n=1 Tax=Vitis vinifera TaxID=29760 RepID=A5BQS2_VITVI|nr:hypothetical protein VITISV_025940 [Vitis vinifera]
MKSEVRRPGGQCSPLITGHLMAHVHPPRSRGTLSIGSSTKWDPPRSKGICGLYERKLKDLNPANQNITYDIADLYNFIDGLADMSALVYVPLSLSVCTLGVLGWPKSSQIGPSISSVAHTFIELSADL